MKTTGIVFLVIGSIALLGVLLEGDSAFGPIFNIGLGLFLIYRANNKESENKTTEKGEQESSVCPTSKNDNYTSYQMTIKQKEAFLCMVSYMAGYDESIANSERTRMLLNQTCNYLGLSFTKETLESILLRNPDGDELIKTLKTIKDKKAKDMLILTCHDLIKPIQSKEAKLSLFKLAYEIDMDEDNVVKLVKQYS